jgi:hypothetical protein
MIYGVPAERYNWVGQCALLRRFLARRFVASLRREDIRIVQEEREIPQKTLRQK